MGPNWLPHGSLPSCNKKATRSNATGPKADNYGTAGVGPPDICNVRSTPDLVASPSHTWMFPDVCVLTAMGLPSSYPPGSHDQGTPHSPSESGSDEDSILKYVPTLILKVSTLLHSWGMHSTSGADLHVDPLQRWNQIAMLNSGESAKDLLIPPMSLNGRGTWKGGSNESLDVFPDSGQVTIWSAVSATETVLTTLVPTFPSHCERSKTFYPTVFHPVSCRNEGGSASAECQLTEVPCTSVSSRATKSPASALSSQSGRTAIVPMTTSPLFLVGGKHLPTQAGCQFTEHPHTLTLSGSNCPVVSTTVPGHPALPAHVGMTQETFPMSFPAQEDGFSAIAGCWPSGPTCADIPTRSKEVGVLTPTHSCSGWTQMASQAISLLGLGQTDGSSTAGYPIIEALPTSTCSEPEKAPPFSPELGIVPDSLICSLSPEEPQILEFQEESESSGDNSVLAILASTILLLPSRHTGLHHLQSAEKADRLPSYLKGERDSKVKIK
ncbi:uncharacterized protein EI90DRAFT_3025056 [Cantharellus anzutake]|uniref:uncharacterized protein n=1 Tax=Cantharellus anzutake TaxID=1750568 RepID=UPI0019066CB9|nr:uncharacterized protein EI90DRAFT_3025056 [Cantharellus anzutake]KAF8309529.1 hypothetical protein EI90DRAFT_3025056 [Cantharellus anzutake]